MSVAALALFCLAYPIQGWRVRTSRAQARSSPLAESQEPKKTTDTFFGLHTEADVNHSRGRKKHENTAQALAALLLARNSAAAFTVSGARGRNPLMSNFQSTKYHTVSSPRTPRFTHMAKKAVSSLDLAFKEVLEPLMPQLKKLNIDSQELQDAIRASVIDPEHEEYIATTSLRSETLPKALNALEESVSDEDFGLESVPSPMLLASLLAIYSPPPDVEGDTEEEDAEVDAAGSEALVEATLMLTVLDSVLQECAPALDDKSRAWYATQLSLIDSSSMLVGANLASEEVVPQLVPQMTALLTMRAKENGKSWDSKQVQQLACAYMVEFVGEIEEDARAASEEFEVDGPTPEEMREEAADFFKWMQKVDFVQIESLAEEVAQIR